MPVQNFLEELKRRKLHKVAISYTVVSWLQIQVGDILFPAFGISEEWIKVLIIALVICFPGILILAWFYDLGPDGFSRIVPLVTKGIKKTEARSRPLTSNYFIASVLLLLLLQYVYFNFIKVAPSIIKTELSADVRLSKIAVIPFTDLSDSAAMEELGEIAAYVISQGFTAFDQVPVVSPFTVTSNIIPSVDSQPGTSFSDLTGAENIITGSYKQIQELIVFDLKIQDASTDEIKFIFPPITGSVSDITSLLFELRKKVLSYWIAREDFEQKLPNLPSYTAYQKYLDMLNEEGEYMKSLEEILQVDSMFHVARIHVLNLTRWFADSTKIMHFEFLDRYQDQMTSYEGLWYSYVRSLYTGDVEGAYESISELRTKFPGDHWINHDAAGVAFNELGNYELSSIIYEELPIRNYEINSELYGFSTRLRNQIVNYAVTGQTQKLETLMSETPRGRFTNFHRSLHSIMTRNNDAYDYWLTNGLKRVASKSNNLVRRFAYDYRSIFSTNTMNSTLVYQTAAFLRSTRESSVNSKTLTRILEVLDEREVSLDLEVSQETIFYSYWTALGLIRMGDIDGVKDIIEQLEQLVHTDMTVTKSYQVYPYYVIGCIYAQMGEDAKAIKYLKEAREAGLFIGHYHFKYDKHLQSLVDNRRFQYLNKPIVP
ncbi:MAG: hypothetical protein JXQ90_03620 [Cyclobacteriaceae bacterium]